jgi:hypothetical protein
MNQKQCRKWIAVLVVMAAMIPLSATARPYITMISVPGSTNIGCVDTLQCASPAVVAYVSRTFNIKELPGEDGYYLSIYPKDTTASAAAAGDTLTFVLVRRPAIGGGMLDTMLAQLAVKSPITKYPYGWNKVYAFAAVSPVNSTKFPIVKHIPLDSLAVYPIIPGQYAWVVYGGRTQAGHVTSKAYTFYGIIESVGAF